MRRSNIGMVQFNVEKFEIARRRANLSNKEVCKRIGVSAGTLCTWKNGKNIPSSENLTKLADLLGVSSSELMLVSDSSSTEESSVYGSERLEVTLLNAAAAVMSVRDGLRRKGESAKMDAEQADELLKETELYFGKIWKIIEQLMKE